MGPKRGVPARHRRSPPAATQLCVFLVAFCASMAVLTPLPGTLADTIGSAPEKPSVPTWEVKHDVVCVAPTGPVQDLRCDVDDVEEANTEQLNGILDELANTTYFRLVKINLDAKCKFWDRTEGPKCNSSTGEYAPNKPKTQCALDMSGSAKNGKKVAFSAPPPGIMGGSLFSGFPGGGGGSPSRPRTRPTRSSPRRRRRA